MAQQLESGAKTQELSERKIIRLGVAFRGVRTIAMKFLPAGKLNSFKSMYEVFDGSQ
jgi:hypothetical protein